MLRISPAGLAAAPVANQLALHLNFREKLCKPYCIDSSNQPSATVEYTTGTPIFNGSTVFVPVTARISYIAPTNCGCNANPQAFTEQFYAIFQGQTGLPTAVTITSQGRVQNGANVVCGTAYWYSINDSVLITITPPAA